MTEVTRVDILSQSTATMVQLYAWTPAHFTQSDFTLSSNQIVPVSMLGQSDVRNLDISMLNFTGLIRLVRVSYSRQLFCNRATALLTHSTQQIMNAGGEITVREMAGKLDCSVRYLQKIFKFHTGMSPKELAVVLKLRMAVDDLVYPGPAILPLTRLALEHHYYDQAHFNNTFKSIVKTSPKRFRPAEYLLSFKR